MITRLFPIFKNIGIIPGINTNSQNINISTSGSANTLSNNLFKANSVDISFINKASKGNKRNLTAQPFLGIVQALNFRGLIYPSVGSISLYTHRTLTGVGNGYNMVESDFEGTGDDYSTYDQGVNTVTWSTGFDKDLYSLTSSLSINYDLCFNAVHGTLSELQSYMSEYNCPIVEFGAELPGNLDPSTYITLVTPFITYLRSNYPSTKIILDAGLVYKNTPSVTSWNLAIKNLDADQARYYMQVSDRVQKENTPFTSDMNANLNILNAYFNTYLPKDLADFHTQLPNFKISVGELQLEDNRGDTQYINNTQLGVWCVGKIFEFIINNNSSIDSVYWMSLKNLIDKDNNTDNNYKVLKQIGSLFNLNNKIQTLSFDNLSGVSGAVVNNGSTYKILLNNSSSTTYTPNVYVNSVKESASFSVQRIYSTSWNGTIISDTIGSLSIPGYSSCIITFTI